MKYMVDNARALLAQFARSDWRELHVRTPDGEIFIARDGGGPNPMLLPAGGAAPPADDANLLTVAAPHVADVAWLLPVGATVAAGGVVARLDLLGEPIDVRCDEGGVVAARFANDGDLVEFETPLVRVARGSLAVGQYSAPASPNR
jgi:hypothetical protein